MPPEKSDPSYLWDRLDAAMAVQQFVHGKTLDEYAQDRLLRGAVERHIEIIGEAASKISGQLRAAHPEIPWRGIIGQRHVLAHDYGEIEDEQIWRVATVHIPAIVKQLQGLLPSAPDAG